MKCSECGEGLREGDRFCIHCGAGVGAAPAVEEAASHPGGCGKCGAALKSDDRFCQECGASVGAAVAEKAPSRLSTPIETKYEAVESSHDVEDDSEVITPEIVAGPVIGKVAQRPKRSNRTFYQLLGLAFILIACSYLAYDYFVTPHHKGSIVVTHEEAEELAQDAPSTEAARTVSVEESAKEALPPRASTVTPRPQSKAVAPQVPVAANLAADVRNTPAANRPPRESVHPSPELNPPVRPAPQVDVTPAATSAPDPAAAEVASPQPTPTPSSPPAAPTAVVSNPPPGAQPPAQPGKVLLPGSQAWKPTPKAAAPQAAVPASAPSRAAVATAPAPPPLNEGIIYWTGKLEKNKVVVIENGLANMGQASGNYFTGVPVDVHLPSPAVALVERPTAQNNWKRVSFRCLRNTSGSVTINIQWSLLR